jgi:uncharacterized phage protein gp47/JayE
MADLVSRNDLYQVGRSYLIAKAIKIDPQQVDVQGTDANIFVGSVSEIAYLCILQLAYSINRLFLDGAEGDDLDRYAWDRYQLLRKGASAALGLETFSRVLATNPAGTIPAGTVLKSQSGFNYLTTTSATFTSGTGAVSDTVAVAAVRAVQAGKLSQVGANSLTAFANPSQVFDPSITCNNLFATAGGEDVEDDDTFRERVRGYWTAQQRGILSAIQYGAIQTPGVVSAQAVEVITNTGAPARLVYLYIADSSGVANLVLAATVVQNLGNWRAAGIQVIVFPTVPQIVSVSMHLVFAAGVNTSALSASVQAAVLNYVNSLPANGTLQLSALYSVLQRYASQGLIVSTPGTIVSPTGDLVPTPGQTLRALASGITLV